jgi:hypothetical protein
LQGDRVASQNRTAYGSSGNSSILLEERLLLASSPDRTRIELNLCVLGDSVVRYGKPFFLPLSLWIGLSMPGWNYSSWNQADGFYWKHLQEMKKYALRLSRS